ncbi:MAG: scyllo-inosose 3-dehydrogenase [Myxococcota bacterium]
MASLMKALLLKGNWEPRPGYHVTPFERASGKAISASTIWRRPQLELTELPVPAVAADEVLIKLKACGVCGSDTHCYETDSDGYVIFSGPARLPCVMGHEYAGEVVEVGRDVTTLKVGDAVAPEGMLWCGKCISCRSGNPNQCLNLEMVGFSSPGAFAEYIVTREKYCWKLDALQEHFSGRDIYRVAALIEPIGCAYNGMFVAAGGLRPGSYVAIYGAGPIGLGAVLMARAAGASKIFVFETMEERCSLARELGADYVYNPRTLKQQGTSPSEVVRELTQGYGADMQVEAAGAAPQTVPEIEKSFAPNGKMVYLGRAAASANMYLDTLVSQANMIVGARGHAGYGIYPFIIRMLATGRIPAQKMITAEFGFDRVLEAVHQSTTRVDGKIMVEFD